MSSQHNKNEPATKTRLQTLKDEVAFQKHVLSMKTVAKEVADRAYELAEVALQQAEADYKTYLSQLPNNKMTTSNNQKLAIPGLDNSSQVLAVKRPTILCFRDTQISY